MVIIPLTSQILLTTFGFSSRVKDLRLSQVSAVVTAVGTIMSGLAETKEVMVASLAVASLGNGFTFLIRGL
jgi:hypothetical protein